MVRGFVFFLLGTLLLILTAIGPASGQDGATASAAASGGRLAVDIAPDEVLLGRYVTVLSETDGPIDPADVLSGRLDDRFVGTTGHSPSFSRNDTARWARITLENRTDRPVERLLVLSAPYYKDLLFFMPDGQGGWIERHLRQGDAVRDTDASNRLPIFRLIVPPGQSDYFLRVDHYFVSFALVLRSEQAQVTIDRQEALLHGISFGILLIIAAYQLALVIMVREGPQLPLFVFVVVESFFMFSQLGYPWLILPHGVASYAYLYGSAPVSVIVSLIFVRGFVSMGTLWRWGDRILIAFQAATAVSLLLFLVHPPWSGPAQVIGSLSILSMMSMVLVLAFRHVEARFIFFAFMPLFLVGFLWTAKVAGAVPALSIIDTAWVFARCLSLVLFTFGVAYVIGRARREREAKLAHSEAALREANERLEDRVRARTAELEVAMQRLKESQDALVQSEKMASLGQLVAGVAHEINTPVGVVVTASSHLLDQTRTIKDKLDTNAMKRSDLTSYLDEAVNACGIVLSNSERAASLVQSFKNVAADQTTDDRRRFTLDELAREVQLSLSPHLKKTGHTVVVSGDSGVTVDTFAGALTRILTNLVMNATIHAYDEGQTGGRIEIAITTPSAEEVEIRVSDDGKGIPAEIQKKIFDPFFTTRRGRGGTGLGLHIVHNLVTERLRGQIRLMPPTGKGSCFSVRFPREYPDSPTEGINPTGQGDAIPAIA